MTDVFQPLIEWFVSPNHLLLVAQVLAAFVTALATFALWRATKVLAVETKFLAQNSERQPFVICSIRSMGTASTTMNVVVENAGDATAFDIEVVFSPGLPKPNTSHDTAAETDTYTISMLPHGRDMVPNSVLSTDIHAIDYTISCSWASEPGGTIREEINYEFSAKDGFKAGWRENGLHQVVDRLDKIEKALAHRK